MKLVGHLAPVLAGPSICVLTLLAHAAPARAHIDPDPLELPAGVPATVTFTVEHGCEDEDTTGFLVQVPTGVTDMVGVQQPGWIVVSDGQTVSFSGGVLDHDTTGTFQVAFTAPAVAGPLDLPVVQQCGDAELRWIEIQQEGAEEPDHPAPRVNVVGEPPATTVAPAATDEATTAVETTTTAAAAAETTAPVATEATTDVGEPAPVTTAPGDDDDSSSVAWPIVIGIVVVAAAVTTALVLSARRKRAAAERPAGDG